MKISALLFVTVTSFDKAGQAHAALPSLRRRTKTSDPSFHPQKCLTGHNPSPACAAAGQQNKWDFGLCEWTCGDKSSASEDDEPVVSEAQEPIESIPGTVIHATPNNPNAPPGTGVPPPAMELLAPEPYHINAQLLDTTGGKNLEMRVNYGIGASSVHWELLLNNPAWAPNAFDTWNLAPIAWSDFNDVQHDGLVTVPIMGAPAGNTYTLFVASTKASTMSPNCTDSFLVADVTDPVNEVTLLELAQCFRGVVTMDFQI